MREHVPHEYELAGPACRGQESTLLKSTRQDTALTLKSTDPGPSATFTFEALTPYLFRTTFTTPDHPLPPYPSAAVPDISFGNTTPSSTTIEYARKRIEVGNVAAVVDWADSPVVSLYLDGDKKPIHRDLNFRSYAIDSEGICHYTAYKRGSLHCGLGEKAAPMDLSGRHYLITATDCFGYDVYRTDPMYKHIPLLISATPKGCVAMFSTSHSRGTWSVGSEVDGLWGHYKVYRQAHGGLEEYLIVGRTIKDVVRIYADLIGYPKLIPRWSLGYIAGGMAYSMLDEPRACDAHLEFVRKLKQHDIPCSAFQMSSGYTVAETEPKTRNVFTWNRHRFPDPRGFTKKFHAAGIRLIANVKPYLLANHPEYDKLATSGALFTDPTTGGAAVCRLWSAGGGESGEGSHLDFTSKVAFQWWYDGCKALRTVGIDGIWNDNNEYTIPNDDWQCALENEDILPAGTSKEKNHIGLWGRAMQTELMGKASHDALFDLEPNVRPFVLTRSATAGTMRYASTSWSGDNVTSWEGMKGANALSLNAGMSLIQSYGHDIGGFEGPQPSPELLLRWIQLGVYSPRFTINCFKTSPDNNLVGDVIEPWMYPAITPLIRETIKRRYEIIPYLYSLALESHMSATPPQRWLGWGYESDPVVWSAEILKGETQYWLGDSLIVGGVYQPGVSTARMYLPLPPETTKFSPNLLEIDPEPAYINLNAPYDHIPGGLWIEIQSQWRNSIPLIARIGGCIPVGKSVPTASPLDDRSEFPFLADDDWRGVEIFPPIGNFSGRLYTNTWYEDDGISSEASEKISAFTISYQSFVLEIHVGFEKGKDNAYDPLWKDLSIILPVGDERVVISINGAEVLDLGRDKKGRRVFKMAFSAVE